jgi:hypothetical protein
MSWEWVRWVVAGAAPMLAIVAMMRHDHRRTGAAPTPGRCYFG